MKINELLKNKSVLNSIEQIRQSLNKRWFDIVFFATKEKTGFYIEEIK